MATAAATTNRKRSRPGPDRLSAALFTLAAFLVVLALLATQLKAPRAVNLQPQVLVRRIYETRTVETVIGSSRRGSSSTQSVSSSASAPAPGGAVVTRTS
jgi:hypothetical protein